jgi:hypothetical protein
VNTLYFGDNFEVLREKTGDNVITVKERMLKHV